MTMANQDDSECCGVNDARRAFLLRAAGGLGSLALLDLVGGGVHGQPWVRKP